MAPSDTRARRGLPPSFQISVPQQVASAPVRLSEYLDDDPPSPVALGPTPAPVPPPAEPDLRVVQLPRPETPVPSPVAGDAAPAAEPPLPSGRLEEFPQPPKKQSRKQVNMNPETLQMVDELVDQLCEQCVQGDVKASELFHALVSTLYEAREHLDVAQVKPRGKWGSPTARAFPVSLKNAFRSAIALAHAPAKR